MFWVGGVVAYVAGGGELDLDRFARVSPIAQIGVITLFLLLVIASAAVINRLAHPFLRVLEGLSPVAGLVAAVGSPQEGSGRRQEGSRMAGTRRPEPERSVRRGATRVRHARRPAAAVPEQAGGLPAHYARQRAALGRAPCPGQVRFGHGHRLAAFLAAASRTRATGDLRRSLDASVCTVAWGLLLLVWTQLHWSAVPVGVVTAAAGLVGARATATTFADLVESAFDVYRTSLYDALRHELPTRPDDERALGAVINIELFRGRNDQSEIDSS